LGAPNRLYWECSGKSARFLRALQVYDIRGTRRHRLHRLMRRATRSRPRSLVAADY
jgi:hypothetical protein